MKRILALLLGLMAVLTLAACGGGANSASPGEAYVELPQHEGWTDAELPQADSKNARQSSAKMIFTAQIELETLTFDKAAADINTLVESAEGYYQERNVSDYSSGYRTATFVIRVPADRFSAFCTQVGNVCHTLRMNTAQENVSQTYYDVESRLNTARTKLERLQELLSRAESMDDIITIESAIADTEQTIDSLSGTLRSYDDLVDYSTVRISLQEVYRLSGTQDAPLTLGQRIGNAFSSGLASVGDFFEGLAVFLAYAWLWLLMLAALVLLVIFLIRRGLRRRRRKLRYTTVQTADPQGQE